MYETPSFSSAPAGKPIKVEPLAGVATPELKQLLTELVELCEQQAASNGAAATVLHVDDVLQVGAHPFQQGRTDFGRCVSRLSAS